MWNRVAVAALVSVGVAAEAWGGDLVKLTRARVFTNASCPDFNETCEQLFESEDGLPALSLQCVSLTAVGSCGVLSDYALTRLSWNGDGELYLYGEVGSSILAGGSSSARVRLHRRTHVVIERYGCPCNDCWYCAPAVLQPGLHDFSVGTWQWGEWQRRRFTPLPLDVNADDVVNDADIAAVLAAWGDLKQDNFADTNLDGRVDAVDLVRVLSGWGGDGRE